MPEVITDNLDLWTSALLTKSTAGRGTNNKLEAYGLKKLRALILELAVRGKLVPQDANDEPASMLLGKIAKEKMRLIKEGQFKKEKLLPDIDDEEKTFELPLGWEWVRFGAIAQHNSGKTLDSGRNTGELRDYITTSNLYWGRFDLVNIRQMKITDDELKKCTARKGDLLICEGGEAGRAAVWSYDHEVCFQNHVHRARFYGEEIDPYFAYLFFEKLNATGEIDQHRKGVGISNMSSKALALIALPLPPFAEQHRIVAKVDELMALCDQLEQQQTLGIEAHQFLVKTLLGTLTDFASQQELTEAWSRMASHFDTLFATENSIDQLKKTILQLAVMGKLVSQDPNDEPVSVLLKRIAEEKARLVKEGRIKNTKTPDATEGIEEFFKLPGGWLWVRFDHIAENAKNALKAGPFGSALKKSMYVESGYKIYGQEQVIAGDENYGDYYINQEKYESLESCAVKPGDILISLVGTIGRVLVLSENAQPGIINPRLVKVGLYKEIFRPYIQLVLASPLIQDELNGKSHGGTMDILNLGLIRSLTFPLPPINEQHRIVAKVNELMALCDALKARFADAQTTQIHLADAIVEQAVA